MYNFIAGTYTCTVDCVERPTCIEYNVHVRVLHRARHGLPASCWVFCSSFLPVAGCSVTVSYMYQLLRFLRQFLTSCCVFCSKPCAASSFSARSSCWRLSTRRLNATHTFSTDFLSCCKSSHSSHTCTWNTSLLPLISANIYSRGHDSSPKLRTCILALYCTY